jgi:hypothetical protein
MYEIPVSERVYEKLRRALHGDGFCLFRLEDEQMQHCLFVLAHGSEEGLIDVRGHLCTPEAFLRHAVESLDVKAKGIDTIYTISCYGGLQKNASYEGVTIQSCHAHLGEIHCRVMALLDGFVLEVSLQASL